MQGIDASRKRKNKRRIALLTIAAVLAISIFISILELSGCFGWNNLFVFFGLRENLSAPFTASFPDIGTADACVIRCGNTALLVDTGSLNSYEKLRSFLNRNGFLRFDAVVLSSSDSDYAGGFKRLAEDFEIDRVFMPDSCVSCSVYGAEFVTPKASDSLSFGDIKLSFVYISKSDLVTRVSYGEKSFLFTGNIGREAEQEILNSNIEIKSNVLKAASHASSSSSSKEFLEAVKPEISVVTVSESDMFLPDYAAIARLNKYSGQVLRTDEDRTIVISVDGEKISSQKYG